MNIKRILREETQNQYVDKVFDTIKGGLGLDPKKKVRFGFGDFDDSIDPRSGIYIILSKKGYLHDKMLSYFVERYGMTEEESEHIITKIRHYLKKENFVEKIAWVLYEDFIQYQENPYYYVDYDDPYEDKVYNLKKLDDFIEFLRSVYSLEDFYDVHSDERVDFGPMLDKSDYEYIQNDVIDFIRGVKDPTLYESISIKKILKEEKKEKSYIERKRSYGFLRSLQYWDDEERSYVNPPSTDPEVMSWITKDFRHRIQPLIKPIGPNFKFQTVGVKVPFIDKGISMDLFINVDVQDVTTKEELASLHGEEIVDGFIGMMYDDYELTDELSILEQYKQFARFCKIMGEHHKQEHRW